MDVPWKAWISHCFAHCNTCHVTNWCTRKLNHHQSGNLHKTIMYRLVRISLSLNRYHFMLVYSSECRNNQLLTILKHSILTLFLTKRHHNTVDTMQCNGNSIAKSSNHYIYVRVFCRYYSGVHLRIGFQGRIGLTLKHRETHGCVVSTVATDALVLKHQTISIHNAD